MNRKRKVIVGAAIVATALAGGIGLASARGGAPAPTTAHLCTSAATCGLDHPANGPGLPNGPGSGAAFTAWYQGTGYADFTTVDNDITTLTTDAQAGDVAQAESDGGQLSNDAIQAAENPPPMDSALYTQMMDDFELAGSSTAGGDFSSSSVFLDKANAILTTITNDLKSGNG